MINMSKRILLACLKCTLIFEVSIIDRWLEGEHYHLEGDFMRPTLSGVVFGVDFEFGC